MADENLQVVFGAGQVGPPLAAILRESGLQVRIVRRSSGGDLGGIPVVEGDAGDPAFATAVSSGAAAIYHCLNPAYDEKEWARELPRFMEALIAAASRTGARLVVLDNLYSLGSTEGRPINEDTPTNPISRKGEIRARVAATLFEAHRRGDARAVVGRASDFYGPGGHGTFFGDLFWNRVLAGKSAQAPMNPDTRHSWHYIPDVAAGLATLGSASDDVCGSAWMLPVAPAVTTRDMVERLGEALGREIRIERVPSWMLAAMGWFVPVLREVSEMLYQWDEPFVVDDSRFRARFSHMPTALDAGVRETVAWARATFGAAGERTAGAQPAGVESR